MKETENIITLIRKNLRGELSLEERSALESWADQDPAYRQLLQELTDEIRFQAALKDFADVYDGQEQEVVSRMLARIQAGIASEDVSVHRRLYPSYKWLAAAAVLIVASATVFYVNRHQKILNPESGAKSASGVFPTTADVRPGGNKATLTLANGSIIDLESDKEALVIDAGKLSYNDGSKVEGVTGETEGQGAPTALNSIVTPAGGTYQIILADGTKVWLNASSELKYPAVFDKKKREVFLIGEGYFEVSASPEKPFYVKTVSQVTQVLGTAFNISAYQDLKEVRTTLVEGSVRVLKPSGQSIILQPGQEAVNYATATGFSVVTADFDETNAWHNGYFSFNEKSIVHIMQQVARWYDIEVSYKGNVAKKKFGGVVRRSNSLAQVLNIFKQTKALDYKIEGRKVTIIVK